MIYVTADAALQLQKQAIGDGRAGLDDNEARQRALKSGSLGIISMEERAHLAGGRIGMRTVKGAGTTINATFVLDPARMENA